MNPGWASVGASGAAAWWIGVSLLRWKNLFITGPRGAGKSTILFRSLAACGVGFGGFAVKKRYTGGRLSSLIMIDLSGCGRSDLVVYPEQGGILAPEFHRDAFTRVAIPAVRRAAAGPGLVIVDELGRIELGVPDFTDLIMESLSSPVPVVGALKAEANPFLDGIRAFTGTRIVHVDQACRQAAFLEFNNLLRELLRTCGVYWRQFGR